MIELSNIAFFKRNFKDKNIHNQQVDYDSDGLLKNDNGDINKEKNLKTWMGIFKNMAGNFPGENFLGGNIPGEEEFTRGEFHWWEFSGWKFSGWEFS